MHQFLQQQWQKRGAWAWLLSPLSLLVYLLAWSKRKGYQLNIFNRTRMPLPIIVVGNLTVGGTGKTPLVIHLCELLTNNGYRPGIISRGYKAKSVEQSQLVKPDTEPSAAGDEAVLLAVRTQCPVMVGADRIRSVRKLIDQTRCNIVVSDDGFQHLKLDRDVDIIVRDAVRGYGNGWCLPSGPLRESFSAQDDADFIMHNGSEKTGKPKHFSMTLTLDAPLSLKAQDPTTYSQLCTQTIHAVAAIGNPERFFLALENQGLTIIRHPFPDHYAFTDKDLVFDDSYPIIMTQKDAVKCEQLNLDRTIWVAPVTVAVSPEFDIALLDKINLLATDR